MFYLSSVNTDNENIEISKTKLGIDKCEIAIANVEYEIKMANSMIFEGPKDLQHYWIDEVRQLREKEKLLREKEKLLREEKKFLLDKLDKLEGVTKGAKVFQEGSYILAYCELNFKIMIY